MVDEQRGSGGANEIAQELASYIITCILPTTSITGISLHEAARRMAQAKRDRIWLRLIADA